MIINAGRRAQVHRRPDAGQPRSDSRAAPRTRTAARRSYRERHHLRRPRQRLDPRRRRRRRDLGRRGAPVQSYTNNYDADRRPAYGADLRSDYCHPFNPGNVLGYNPTTARVPGAVRPERPAAQDPADAGTGDARQDDRRAALELAPQLRLRPKARSTRIWASRHGVRRPCRPTATTCIFGDLGNDWIVGGTGRDTLCGGWGNDLLNADDVLNTDGGLNDRPDTNPSYEDFAYGGAGRDVLIANTGGDRLIDWVGEFNSYLVPFAPFGDADRQPHAAAAAAEYPATRSRRAQAPTRRSPRSYGGDPARNGEPFGELGLVASRTRPWGDQTRRPARPAGRQLAGRPARRAPHLRHPPDQLARHGSSGRRPLAGFDRARRAGARHGRVHLERRSDPRADRDHRGDRRHRAIHVLERQQVDLGQPASSGTTASWRCSSTSRACRTGTVTVSATLTLNGRTSAVGSTSVGEEHRDSGLGRPGAPGLCRAGRHQDSAFVHQRRRRASTSLGARRPRWTRSPATASSTRRAALVTLDFTGNTDGVYYLTRWQQDHVVGNLSPVGCRRRP